MDISEDAIKGPSGNMRREQSSFPQDYGISISFGGDGISKWPKRKTKKKRKSIKEALDEIIPTRDQANVENKANAISKAVADLYLKGR